jgi:hypothetical protein
MSAFGNLVYGAQPLHWARSDHRVHHIAEFNNRGFTLRSR